MARLTPRHWSKLLDCVGQLHTCHDLDDFPQHVMRVLRVAVPADFAVYDEIHIRRSLHRWVSDPPGLDLRADAEAHASFFEDHPFVLHLRRTGDMPPLRLSDLLSRRQYHETGFYREAYRKFGVEHQIGFTLPAPSPAWTVGVAFNRSRREFSDEERQTFELLRPHLFQAYRNAEVVTRLREAEAHAPLALTSGPLAVITIDARGRSPACPPHVRQWLADYFGQVSDAAGTLPDALRRWLEQRRLRTGHSATVPPPRGPLVLERLGRRLTVRILDESGSGHTLAIEERRTEPSAELLAPFGLTGRQAEVLLWVMQGKTNPDVARILSLRASTVDKHIEHIFARLGVETRTAAAARAWELIAGVSSTSA